MKIQKANDIISYVSLFGDFLGEHGAAFRACLLVGFCLALSACGGGGSIARGGDIVISGIGAVSEFGAQSGLALVSAASAYQGGYDGQAVKVGVVDSGIDGGHSELAGHVNGGGDWQGASNGLFDPFGHGTNVASVLGGARDGAVMHGVLSGQSNKEIARKHGLREVTIKHHLKSLRSKLGARNRTHAVCRAIELGVAEDSQVFA